MRNDVDEIVVISDDLNLLPTVESPKRHGKIKRIVQKIKEKKPNAKVFSFDPSKYVSPNICNPIINHGISRFLMIT